MSTIHASSAVGRALHAAGFLVLACGIATLVACSVVEQPVQVGNATQSIPVEVASATHQSITANYSGTATLEAVADAQVVAKAPGIVFQILGEERTQVRGAAASGRARRRCGAQQAGAGERYLAQGASRVLMGVVATMAS